MRLSLSLGIAAAALMALSLPVSAQTLLNVSYDPTRELYRDFNAAFAAHQKADGKDAPTVRMSHGGSGAQARTVIDGLDADVVTLALQADIDAIAKATKKIPENWRTLLPHNSSPYTSTIVFLVRKGNPKAINDWGDLVKDGVQVITPNPKTSGGARWNYLAAWAWANKQYGGDAEKVKGFVGDVYRHVPVLDTGARGSTTTFVQRGIGDVLLAWENEAFLALEELGPDQFEIKVPSISILAEPPVALVPGNTDTKGTTEVAKAYLDYLYSPEGQTISAKHYYRPSEPEKVTDKALLERFPQIDLVKIDDAQFGGWAKVQPEHFGDGGIFDQIYKPAN
ncbi:sulfate ABC transporter substrate-binding protein [Aureimonas phyllosphaerae]|uniref:Sulfate transport system substrate-binding protein n=1 Tax=Aureimonas phyllosphaerae TaxID=1166078 RepID=A0A7W6FUB1_9HYPH|nr:sulfate ABC transporter substrate-binding protein [Aureimonas phyllosphaerae]MBB3935911.1 sulfate transport system substrate-binding protein [Aureimonas phyllosphaerae]MBB3960364.1 sulfate transport system substrate-binding protein [Aureimonas phyllosphaerae]SFF36981.1 sulfate transport system substrate-binding protein [Aureimonas phyllosphaerae]